MPTLGGKHVQARTGRELTWWCVYEVVGEAELSYTAVINEGRDYLGQHEAALRYDPAHHPTSDRSAQAILVRLCSIQLIESAVDACADAMADLDAFCPAERALSWALCAALPSTLAA